MHWTGNNAVGIPVAHARTVHVTPTVCPPVCTSRTDHTSPVGFGVPSGATNTTCPFGGTVFKLPGTGTSTPSTATDARDRAVVWSEL